MKNAEIEYAHIFIESHGFLTIQIGLDYGDGTGQSFGGMAFMCPLNSQGRENYENCGNIMAVFIDRVFAIAGVDTWKDLVGKTIRVEAAHDGVKKIGHITKDIWFGLDDLNKLINR